MWTYRFLVLCLLLLSAVSGEAVMPPEHYGNMARQSKVRAIAVVESVRVVETTQHSTAKEVVFRLRHSFSGELPEFFSGTCFSVDHVWQQPMAGGTIYFYPGQGELVYVTVGRIGGTITSYTHLDENLESFFIDNNDKIRNRM